MATNTLIESAKFSRPYVARYWVRFALGIFLGLLFGFSNSLSLGSIYVVLYRLDDPKHVEQINRKGPAGQGPSGMRAKAPRCMG